MGNNGSVEKGADGKEVRMNDMLEYPIAEDMVDSPLVRLFRKVSLVIDGPVSVIREFIERHRGPPYPYYHQKFRRVATIDQCYVDDHACFWEANEQYKRDKKVDDNIVNIVRKRFFNCVSYNRGINEFNYKDVYCVKEKADFQEAELNYFIKYGDIGPYATVTDAFYKQKHRLIFERRQQMKNNELNA